jgi:hypothetical protein
MHRLVGIASASGARRVVQLVKNALIFDLKRSTAEVWLLGSLARDLYKNTLVSSRLLILQSGATRPRPLPHLEKNILITFCSDRSHERAADAQPEQISEIHRLHLSKNGRSGESQDTSTSDRHTVAKYLAQPALPRSRRDRLSKLDALKSAVVELLQQDPKATASVLRQRLQTLGYDGGITILTDSLQAVRTGRLRARVVGR